MSNYGNKQYDNTNRGGLFPRNKTTPKSPDMGGDIELGGEVLQYILDNARHGNVKIYLSAWREQLRQGGTRISLSARLPVEATQQGQQQGRGGYNQSPVQNRGGYQQGNQQGHGGQGYGGGNQQGGYAQQSRGGYGNQGGGAAGDLSDDIPFSPEWR